MTVDAVRLNALAVTRTVPTVEWTDMTVKSFF